MSNWAVGRILRYVSEWRSSERFDRPPVVLNLPVTDNCNARCVMCDVWKERARGDFTVGEFGMWASSPLLADVAHVGISGGEPTLRKDLPELVETICSRLPGLKSLSVTTHGFHPRRWARYAPVLRDIAAAHAVPFRINISIDGVGAVHDAVRRVPGGFSQAERTIECVSAAGVALQIQCTVSRLNVYHVTETLAFARQRHLDIIYRVATEIARLDNRHSVSTVALSPDERSFFADFLLSDSLLNATSSPARRLFYRDLALRLESNAPRRAPCSFQRRGVLVAATGVVYQCSIATQPLGDLRRHGSPDWEGHLIQQRKEFVDTKCPSCVHDQTGHWPPSELASEVLRQTRFGRGFSTIARAAELPRLALRLQRSIPTGTPAHQGRHALLIGAYGGEHVGDAAILGGIILRLFEEHGVSSFTVLSFRPGRTRRWVRSLRLPRGCSCHVISYSAVEAGHLRGIVCYAGGPIMDLPLLNSRAALILTEARRRGLTVLIEGVGIGPFRRAIGTATARWMLSTAHSVTVRTPVDAELARQLGRTPDAVTLDPAEDYVASELWRGSETKDERTEIQRAVAAAGEEGPVAVWNLRPLALAYAAGKLADFRSAQESIRESVAAAVGALPQFRHVFFAMNADQYGESDLDEAREVISRVRGRPALVARELGVGGVLELMTRADVVVAMRFHACVFAIALRKPLVGIDYGVGIDQKVSRLMARSGRDESCTRVDRTSADWLTRRVALLAGSALPPAAGGHAAG